MVAVVPAWRSRHGDGAGDRYMGDWAVGGNADLPIRVAELDWLPKLSLGASHASSLVARLLS